VAPAVNKTQGGYSLSGPVGDPGATSTPPCGGAQRICHGRLFAGIGVVIKYLGLVANRIRYIVTRSLVKITVGLVNPTAYAVVKRCARGCDLSRRVGIQLRARRPGD
jgi:hypothetical protein